MGGMKAHTIGVDWQYEWQLSHINFHAPSEHTVNGDHYDLELQAYNTISGGSGDFYRSNAVVSILFEEGDENPWLKDVIDNTYVNWQAMFGAEMVINDFYMYVGSFTTPPCSETVNWYVWTIVQEASAAQIEFFSTQWEDNDAFADGNETIVRFRNRG
jgi:carbonic anhydrase